MNIITQIKKILKGTLFNKSLKNTFWAVLGKMLGLVIPFLIAFFFGVNSKTDVFLFAYSVVLFSLNIFIPNIERLSIPFLVRLKAEKNNISNMINNYIIINIILTLLMMVLLLFSHSFFRIITDFGTLDVTLLIQYLLLFLPFIMGMLTTSFLVGVLNANEKFTFASLSPIIRSVIIIFMVLQFHTELGLTSVIIGYNLGELFRLIILMIYLNTNKIINTKLEVGDFKKNRVFLKMLYPLLIGSLLLNINTIIGKAMSSWLGVGSVSVLHYSERMYMIPFTFSVIGFMPIFTSIISKDIFINNIDTKKLKVKITKIIYSIILFNIILFIVIYIIENPLMHLLSLFQNIDNESIKEVVNTFYFFMLGLAGNILLVIFIQLIVILNISKVIPLIGLVTGILNLSLNYVFMKVLGTSGIALGTSLTYMIISILSYKFMISDLDRLLDQRKFEYQASR